MPAVASENNVQVLCRKLEEALTKNSELLLYLRKVLLFNPTTKTCLNAEVIIEVGKLNDTTHTPFCKCADFECVDFFCEYGNWTYAGFYTICPAGTGELQTLLLSYQMTTFLLEFDPLLYSMITIFSNINRNNRFNYHYYTDPDITLSFFIDTLDILPGRYELSEVTATFLSLVSNLNIHNTALNDIM